MERKRAVTPDSAAVDAPTTTTHSTDSPTSSSGRAAGVHDRDDRQQDTRRSTLKAASRLMREVEWLLPLFEGNLEFLHLYADLSWTESLDSGERRQMKEELISALRDAIITGEWHHYDNALHDWRATADVLGDPELTADLNAEWDPSQAVPLKRP